ncbi:EamA family transporter [Helicobacter sp. 16-1353]|uniref:EamA family transporter n=1 Tax=Helicobacter sp. 16-1353 TaxID=2004996 RepID=UPI00215D15CD|nr:EamA family transporter [Helicobacter sp. 16-1353]
MWQNMWIIYALLAAFFAALTSIFAKVGITGVNADLATAIRTAVVLVLAWVFVFVAGSQSEIAEISKKSWIFLILSGVATGFSWLFFYRALQLGEASKVVPIDKFSVVITMILAFIFLQEAVSLKVIIGGVLITAGTLILAF